MIEVLDTIMQDDVLRPEDFLTMVKYSNMVGALMATGPFHKTLPVE